MTEATIALESAEELFAAPVPDPLAGRFETHSGMDRLLDRLTPAAARSPLTVVVEVPDADAGLAARLRPAIAGYVGHRVAELRTAKRQIERRGYTELALGLVFLAACLALSSAAVAIPAGPEWLGFVVAEGLVIVGWIALWHPVDMLLFERGPLRREIRLLEAIAAADLRATPPTAAATPSSLVE